MDIDAKGLTSLFWDITFIRRYLLLYHFVLPFSVFLFHHRIIHVIFCLLLSVCLKGDEGIKIG